MLDSNAPEPLEALGLFRALPIALALGLLAWASLATVAYGIYLLAR
jgi:hypothetical protein